MTTIAIPGTNLLIGSEADCGSLPGHTLHACKNPCWVRAVGAPKLDKDDPRYLWADSPNQDGDLYLNLIDPPVPLFQLASFTKALDWLDEHASDEQVLIHCNAGLSRAPSIALVWMDKRHSRNVRAENLSSFALARHYFTELYPTYAPGAGIVTWLSEHWAEIT